MTPLGQLSQIDQFIVLAYFVTVIIVVAVGWQVSSVVMVISLLLHKWGSAAVGMGLFGVLTGVLYVSWYRNLEKVDQN